MNWAKYFWNIVIIMIWVTNIMIISKILYVVVME